MSGMGEYADYLMKKFTKPTSEDTIDQIQKVREQNNKNWMDLFRLAFKCAPEEAKIIMSRISKCDHEINELMEKLV